VSNRLHRVADPRGVRPPLKMRKSGDATQDSNLAEHPEGRRT
jgi:hypothetical protein